MSSRRHLGSQASPAQGQCPPGARAPSEARDAGTALRGAVGLPRHLPGARRVPALGGGPGCQRVGTWSQELLRSACDRWGTCQGHVRRPQSAKTRTPLVSQAPEPSPRIVRLRIPGPRSQTAVQPEETLTPSCKDHAETRNSVLPRVRLPQTWALITSRFTWARGVPAAPTEGLGMAGCRPGACCRGEPRGAAWWRLASPGVREGGGSAVVGGAPGVSCCRFLDGPLRWEGAPAQPPLLAEKL